MGVIRYHIMVSGIVQGVGFRYFTQNLARKLHLSGWVRNTSDGHVELEAQGDEQLLEKFIVALRLGPSLSRVENLEIEKIQLQNSESGFLVTS